MARKVIVNDGDIQRVMRLSASSNTRLEIVYDEASHGPLPDTLLGLVGGLKRTGDTVGFDQNIKDAHDAAVAAKEQVKLDKEERKQRIKNNAGSANSINELKQVVQDLVDHLGL